MAGKQQQQRDAMATVRPAFHALSAAAFGYTLFYDMANGGTAPLPGVFASKLVWLTFVDLVSVACFFIIGFTYFPC
jgi:hypothetical protein